MLIKSFDKKYLEYVEKEFEAQIVKLLNDGIIPVSINSHVHTHSIPKFFEIVSRLAQKYGIKYVRTQKENFYFVPNLKRHLNLSYFVNIIKNIILNTFTFINKNTLKKYKCKTNENFLGVLYTLNMDKSTIIEGLKAVKDNSVVEIILHPTLDKNNHNHYVEYETLMDKEFLKDVEFIQWKDIS